MKMPFAHPNPKFGTKNKPLPPSNWENTIYYLWFQYLRRNEDYLRTCRLGGKGKCAKLYKDFGDVRTDDFKTWWKTDERGVYLFADEPLKIKVLTDGTVLSTCKDRTLVLEIPLELPSAYIVKRFKEILGKHHLGVRGVKSKTKSSSNVRYLPTTDRRAIEFLKTALIVWEASRAEPKKKLWQLAQDLNLSASNHVKSDHNGNPVDNDGKPVERRFYANNKKILASTASRYLRKANAAIANTALGRFPDYTRSAPTLSESKLKAS